MSDIKIDDDWKEQAQAEKDALKDKFEEEKGRQSENLPEADFLGFISGLSAQAMMQLGEIENAMTGKKEASLPMAKYTIDILGMLEEKTKGNLTDEEAKYMNASLYQLRMMFVSKSKETDKK